jgi:DNA-binding PadR family transcriptional regulator
MRFRMGGCGARRFDGIPEAVIAMSRGGHWGGNWGPFGIDIDWKGPGGRGRRGGGGRMFDSGELRLVLLKLIADQPRHGYDLIRAIEDLTHGSYAPSPGVVYPTLTMLEDMGLIASAQAEGTRKAYSITPEGEAHLADNSEQVDALFERLTGVGVNHRKAGGAPIKRAVGNLLSALWNRVTREDADEQILHDVAAILDEAAQKIERLKRA